MKKIRIVALMIFAMLAGFQLSHAQNKKPNIILIVVDDIL